MRLILEKRDEEALVKGTKEEEETVDVGLVAMLGRRLPLPLRK